MSAGGTVTLSVLYAVPLTLGLVALPSRAAPIGDPWFPIMEILIIVTMPFMIGLMVAVHAWAPAETKVYGVLAVLFMGLATVITTSVHFVVLTVSHRPELVGQEWVPAALSFRWLSLTYALDVVAWDVFFPLAALSAALVFRGSRLDRAVRILLIISGTLSLAGLSGIVLDDSDLRSIGIAGYAGVFPVAALLLVVLFHRARPGSHHPGPGRAPAVDRKIR